ncbi:MAG: peptidase M16, partial [Spirochaetales bacterium]|nr:peptidase M16 [Spirochaetales bacterium]
MTERRLAVGDELHGFIVEEITPLAEYRGTGYLFRHIETRMEVYQVVNEDPERFFGYLFRTLPCNDTGVAHIIEHCLLAGSERYPVRDPFMTLLKGSANTFMNALTYPDRTVYPAASPLEKDFDNLFSVYTDAVFAPLLREETFQREGVRLVCTDEGCRYEGVVFNEMLGAGADHDEIVSRSAVRTLFPDTPYSFESGGDPEAIIGLTYREFRSFYDRYYHPSNAKLFLFGKMEAGAKLRYLDEHYLQRRGMLRIDSIVPLAKRWERERSATFSSPMEEGGEEVKNASVVLSWATTENDDPLEVMTLSTLVDILLGNPAAPLYKALIDSDLALDISPESGMSAEFRQMPFIVGFKGIDPEDGEKAKEVILSALKRIVRDGIESDLIETSLKRTRFSQLEIPGGIPTGLRALTRATRAWMVDRSPSETIRVVPTLDELEKRIRKNPRHFEDWIEEHLLSNPHRTLVTVKPDGEHQKRQSEAIAREALLVGERLGRKGLKEIAEENKRFLAFEEEPDSAEDLEKIPFLRLEDLPKEIRTNDHCLRIVGGRKLWIRTIPTNGIVYADIAFTIDDLAEEELMILNLYTRLVQTTGLGKLPYEHVAQRIRRLTGGFSIFVEVGTSLEGKAVRHLIVRVKTLADDFDEALIFIGELLRGANVDDKKRIRYVFNNYKSEFSEVVTYSATNFAASYATRTFSEAGRDAEQIGGLSQWFHLTTLDPDTLGTRFKELGLRLANRRRLVAHVSCEEPLVENAQKSIETFITGFEDRGALAREPAGHGQVGPTANPLVNLFKLPSTVSYAAWALRSAKRGSVIQSAQVLLAQVLTTGTLWETIRGQGGAYGVSAATDVAEETFILSTYRDPRIAGTFIDLKRILEEAATRVFTEKEIEDSTIFIVGRELRPLSPGQDALLGFRRILYSITDEFRLMRRTQLLGLSSEDLNEG